MSSVHAQPAFSHSQVTEIIKRLFDLTLSKIQPLPSYDDQNFHVVTDDGVDYVLKIMNSEDSKNFDLIDVQTYAMSFLHQNGLPTQTAVPTTTGQLLTLEEIDCGYGLQKYLVRLLTYLPGTMICKVTVTPQLLYETGRIGATMDQILLKLDHPHIGEIERKDFRWSLSSIHVLDQYLHLVKDEPLRKVVESVFHLYRSCVEPNRPHFRKCINHGDFNDLNVLVQLDENNDYKITGILDFGDCNSGYFIHELAIAIMYMMIEHPNPVQVGGPFLAGWESVFLLNQAERECLFVLVLCRFCQSIVLGHQAVVLHPENEEYLTITTRKGVRILQQLWDLGKEEVEKIWFQDAARFRKG